MASPFSQSSVEPFPKLLDSLHKVALCRPSFRRNSRSLASLSPPLSNARTASPGQLSSLRRVAMSRRAVRLPTDGRPFLDLLSLGRPGPSGRFSPAQIEQIRRTVSRTPEVMVKVTGGGTKTGAVAAHLAYISRKIWQSRRTRVIAPPVGTRRRRC